MSMYLEFRKTGGLLKCNMYWEVSCSSRSHDSKEMQKPLKSNNCVASESCDIVKELTTQLCLIQDNPTKGLTACFIIKVPFHYWHNHGSALLMLRQLPKVFCAKMVSYCLPCWSSCWHINSFLKYTVRKCPLPDCGWLPLPWLSLSVNSCFICCYFLSYILWIMQQIMSKPINHVTLWIFMLWLIGQESCNICYFMDELTEPWILRIFFEDTWISEKKNSIKTMKKECNISAKHSSQSL